MITTPEDSDRAVNPQKWGPQTGENAELVCSYREMDHLDSQKGPMGSERDHCPQPEKNILRTENK